MRKKVYILLTLLLFFLGKAHAQQVVHKVSKNIQKNYSATITKLEILGEKSTISVLGWNQNYISVEVVLISRNANEEDAINDINYIKFKENELNKKLEIKNYFDGTTSKITSNLSIEYHIKLPKSIELNINNLYGKITLNNLNNSISASNSFGSIELNKIIGDIEIRNKYCNLIGSEIEGKLSCIAEKSDIKLTKFSSEISVESKYGEIELYLENNQHTVTINSHRSTVNIIIPQLLFNYHLQTLNNKITLPAGELKDENYQLETSPKAATINIKTTYCPINISYEKP